MSSGASQIEQYVTFVTWRLRVRRQADPLSFLLQSSSVQALALQAICNASWNSTYTFTVFPGA